MIAAPTLRYEAETHQYFLDDQEIPGITSLIDRGGLLGDAALYYTEASRRRGTAVHDLTRDYDLGVLELQSLNSPFRSYALAYVAACFALKPEWENIEEIEHHRRFRFGCRPDRVGQVMRVDYLKRPDLGSPCPTIVEIKSAVKAAHHTVQTAGQAIAVSDRTGFPATKYQRLVIYVKPTGKYSVERNGGFYDQAGRWVDDFRDFDAAMRLIKEFAL